MDATRNGLRTRAICDSHVFNLREILPRLYRSNNTLILHANDFDPFTLHQDTESDGSRLIQVFGVGSFPSRV